MRVISANVNGIRAALRRGGVAWMADRSADIVALQEVRADDDQLAAALTEGGLGDMRVSHAGCRHRGRAGVAVLSRVVPEDVRVGLGDPGVDDSGRWIEVDLTTDIGAITVVSVYVHKGEAGTQRQEAKYRFLAAMTERMEALAAQPVLVLGDLNVAHRSVDLKNWKPNQTRSGFLPEERAFLDRWLADQDGPAPWVDLGRALGGPGPGPYTWWTWRGRAFDNDAGWRIDYGLASRALSPRVRSVTVGRADSYARRWSDHAALVLEM